MRPKFGSTISPPDGADDSVRGLYSHVQSMTDDLKSVIDGNLSVKDNLPFEYRKQDVKSGDTVLLSSTQLPKLAGVHIVSTGGAHVLSFSTTVTNKGVQVVLSLDKPSATITFILYGDS